MPFDLEIFYPLTKNKEKSIFLQIKYPTNGQIL